MSDLLNYKVKNIETKDENGSRVLIIKYRDTEETTDLRFDSETSYGEPQMWIELCDGTYLELTHEEDGLGEEEQFYSLRQHCAGEDFENYEETYGVLHEYAGSLEGTLEEMKELINKEKKVYVLVAYNEAYSFEEAGCVKVYETREYAVKRMKEDILYFLNTHPEEDPEEAVLEIDECGETVTYYHDSMYWEVRALPVIAAG